MTTTDTNTPTTEPKKPGVLRTFFNGVAAAYKDAAEVYRLQKQAAAEMREKMKAIKAIVAVYDKSNDKMAYANVLASKTTEELETMLTQLNPAATPAMEKLARMKSFNRKAGISTTTLIGTGIAAVGFLHSNPAIFIPGVMIAGGSEIYRTGTDFDFLGTGHVSRFANKVADVASELRSAIQYRPKAAV